MKIINGKVFQNGKLFSGVLYSKYDNGQLELLEHYSQGVLNGSSARWYKNGHKQMEAIFRKGRLNGYFKGWFENGDLKFDYSFQDKSREEETLEEEEKDGDAGSGQKDH